MAAATAIPSAAEEAPSFVDAAAYESHYFVAGFRGDDGTPVVVAADFNRSAQADGGASVEYKLFVAEGANWSLPVYEQLNLSGKEAATPGLPALPGVRPHLAPDGSFTLAVNLPGTRVNLEVAAPSYPFGSHKHALGTVHTDHSRGRLHVNGREAEVLVVHELVRFATPQRVAGHVNQEEAGEANRRLGHDGMFGLYDWIVLYDDQGRLYHLSSGTQTEDFAYRLTDAGPEPAEAFADPFPAPPQVRWLKTRPVPDGPDTPLAWQVDVPAWGFRAQLVTTGEHGGRGEPDPSGFRAVYRQVGVSGVGVVDGEAVRLHGMVEHIAEAPIRTQGDARP